MPFYESNPISRLRQAIEAEIEENGACLVDGVASTYPEYKGRVGYIKGLKRAVELCEESEKPEAEREPKSESAPRSRYED